MSQIKSKKRVADHGEVFTRAEEVNAMLDLVINAVSDNKDQSNTAEIGLGTTFLEPACGTGNFLVEILKRKLEQVERKTRELNANKARITTRLTNATVKNLTTAHQKYYEFHAIFALSTLYGIELLKDNLAACRQNLLDLFQQKYTALFPESYQPQCLAVAEFLLEQNILHGDALAMACCDSNNQPMPDQPLCFSQWAAIDFPRKWCLKREEYVYQTLVAQEGKADPYLFKAEYFPCYFLEIQNAKIVHSIQS